MQNDDNDKLDDPDRVPEEPESAPEFEDSEIPESEHPLLDLAESGEQPDSEVQPESTPEPVKKKKSAAIGFFLWVILLAVAGVLGYPYIQERLFPEPPAIPKPVFQNPSIPSSTEEPLAEPEIEPPPVIENEPPVRDETGLPPAEERPTLSLRLSGAPTEPPPEEDVFDRETDMPVRPGVSGHFTFQEEEKFEKADEPPPAEEEEPNIERSREVQVYLDFIESTIAKISDWVQEGYAWVRGYFSRLPG